MNVDFYLIVSSSNEELYSIWRDALTKLLSPVLQSHFHFLRANLGVDLPPEVKFDAIVSPANSYGRMDGGFDDAISRFLSPADDHLALTRYVQSALYEQYRGFVPPGSAVILRLPRSIIHDQQEKSGCSHLAICPTMHRPEDVSWDRYVVYNTTWSLLCAVDKHNSRKGEFSNSDGPWYPIRSVLMSSLGTGSGKVPYDRFASQFGLAVKNFYEALSSLEKWKFMDWNRINYVEDELAGSFFHK